MAFTDRRQLAARLVAGMASLVLAYPACAAISVAGSASASAEAALDPMLKSALPVELPAYSAVNPADNSTAPPLEPFLREHVAAVQTTQTLSIADPRQHQLSAAGPKEDRDLSANESAAGRGGAADEEALLNENWWQAVPGIVTALVLGLILYMRKPVQRKRKYRTTPHEPTGPYKRRSRS